MNRRDSLSVPEPTEIEGLLRRPSNPRVRFTVKAPGVEANNHGRRDSLEFVLASHNKHEADTAATALQKALIAHAGGRVRRMLWGYRRLRQAALVIYRFMKKSVLARRAFIQRGVALWNLIESEAKKARALRPLPTEETRTLCMQLAAQQGAGRKAVVRRRKGWREVQSWGGVHFCDTATKLRIITKLWEERRKVKVDLPRNRSSVPSPRDSNTEPFAPGAVERVLSAPGIAEYVKSTVAAALLAEGRTGRRKYSGAEGVAERALREAIFGESAPQWSPEERETLEKVCWPPPKEGDKHTQRRRVLPKPLGRKEVEELAIDWAEREQRDKKRKEVEVENQNTLASVSRYYLSAQPHLDGQSDPQCPAPRASPLPSVRKSSRQASPGRPYSADLPPLVPITYEEKPNDGKRKKKRVVNSAGKSRSAQPVLDTLPKMGYTPSTMWATPTEENPERKTSAGMCTARELMGMISARSPRPKVHRYSEAPPEVEVLLTQRPRPRRIPSLVLPDRPRGRA